MHIPGYEIKEKVRDGASATTWRAIQLSLQRPVLVKVIRTDGSDDDALKLERLLDQMRKVAGLKHPCIAEVIDVGSRDGLYYVVTGYPEGQSAYQRMKDQFWLAEGDVLGMAAQVGEALDYAWTRKQLFHGNLKPDNLIVQPDGSTVVLDMGFVLREPVYDESTGETREMVVGTPNYMSPEQVMAQPNVDFHSDIYSLGATLYHLVTGSMPFGETTNELGMYRHLWDRIPNPLDLNAELSPGFVLLLSRMMMKSPNDRFASWSDLIEDARRLRDGKGLPVRQDGGAVSTIRPATNPKGTAAAPSGKALRRRPPGTPVRRQAAATRAAPAKAPPSPESIARSGATEDRRAPDADPLAPSIASLAPAAESRPPAPPIPAWLLLVKWAAVLTLWVYWAWYLLRLPEN